MDEVDGDARVAMQRAYFRRYREEQAIFHGRNVQNLADQTSEEEESEDATNEGDTTLGDGEVTPPTQEGEDIVPHEVTMEATTRVEGPDGVEIVDTIRWSEGQATAHVMDGIDEGAWQQRNLPKTIPRHHRTVNPYEDEGVWVLLDDGCNTPCHSKRWAENARMKLVKKKMKMF